MHTAENVSVCPPERKTQNPMGVMSRFLAGHLGVYHEPLLSQLLASRSSEDTGRTHNVKEEVRKHE